LANLHFVLALAGTLLYILAMWFAGVSQGLLWLSVDRFGELAYGFREVMAGMKPYYGLRLVAGLLFWSGTLLMAWNLFMTLRGRRPLAVAPPPVPEPWRLTRGAVAAPARAGA
jgi:cytochrome c oxidase cbb3-type subunit 1